MWISEHLVCPIRSLYTKQEATVRTEYGEIEWFGTGKRVKRGFIVSPYLFNLNSEHIMRKSNMDDRG